MIPYYLSVKSPRSRLFRTEIIHFSPPGCYALQQNSPPEKRGLKGGVYGGNILENRTYF